MKIDLGSGCQAGEVPDYIHIDIMDLPDIEYVWDLNMGLPKRTWSKSDKVGGIGEYAKNWTQNGSYKVFEDNTVDEIRSHHCFEHLTVEGFMKLMDELWDALKPDGILKVYVPNAECPRAAWGDPTHRKAFSTITFSYFTRGGLSGHPYTNKAWEIVEEPEVRGTPPDDLWEIYCSMRPDKR